MFPNASLAAITLHYGGTLWMYRLNVGIYTRESKHDGKGFRFDDIVEYKGRVLGIDRRCRVYEIKYHSSEMTPFVAPISGGVGRWQKRLVESLGLLYLVVRCKEVGKSNKRQPKFKVYELNEGRKKWCKITCLGDRSFLFGHSFSFSASAQELGSYMKNCILFAKNSFKTYKSGYDDDYEEFPEIEISEIDIRVWHLDDTDHFAAIELYLDYSDSLWPPPSWIWNIDRLKRIGIVETATIEILFNVAHYLKPLDTIWQLHFLEAGNGNGARVAGTDVLDLQKRVNIYVVEETVLMRDFRESMEIWNKVDSLFEQPGTSSHGTTEERQRWTGKLKTGATCLAPLIRSTMSMLRKRDACLFSIEEETTKVIRYMKALPGLHWYSIDLTPHF